jgi:phosphate-selective porin OprO/OprP
MKTKFWAREASLLVLSLVVFSASAAPALADDTAEEIRLLKAEIKQIAPLTQRLKQLEEKVAKQEREKKELRAQVHGAGGGNTGLVTKDGPERPPLPFFVDLSHGLTVESLDHADSFHVGGRVYMDGGGSTMPEKGLSETANLTQARLQVEGRLRSIWEYKFQYDFVGGSNATTVGAVGGIRDAYVALKYPGFRPPFLENPIEIQIGNFYLPHGMERTESKNYIDFIERSLMSDTFGAARHVGVALLDHGANWTFKTALSSTSVEDATLKPGAETLVPYWVPQNQNWVATGGRQYYDITARATYAPIWTEDRLLHFGASARYHRPGDSTAANDDRVLTPGANTYMESNILKENLLGTPDLSCGANPSGLLGTAPGVAGGGVPNPVFGTQIAGTAGAGKCVKDVFVFGAELSGAYGPFSFQGEYMGAQYNRNASAILENNVAATLANTAYAANAKGYTEYPLSPGGSSLFFSGYYISGMLFLTGESKAAAYQVDNNTNGGSFRQIQIKHPLSAGGWGAFALTARYSEVDLNSGPFQGSTFSNLFGLAPTTAGKVGIYNSGVLGGREEDMTVGLNWYAEPGVRVMANWTRVLALSAPYNAPFYNGAHPNTFLVRTQIDW